MSTLNSRLTRLGGLCAFVITMRPACNATAKLSAPRGLIDDPTTEPAHIKFVRAEAKRQRRRKSR